MTLGKSQLIFLVLAGSALFMSYGMTEEIFKVGQIERTYLDESRSNWFEEGSRPIRATIWYPIDDDRKEKIHSIGLPFLSIFFTGS